jgi:putative membrane protein
MRGFIVGTIVTAIALYLIATYIPGYIDYEGETPGLLAIAAIFGVVNGLIGPIVRTLALPLTFMTLGLIGFVINAGLLLLTAWISDQAGFDFTVGDFPPELVSVDTIVGAVVGAIALSVISTIIRLVVRD